MNNYMIPDLMMLKSDLRGIETSKVGPHRVRSLSLKSDLRGIETIVPALIHIHDLR